QGMGNGAAILMQHTPADDDSLAQQFAGVRAGEIAISLANALMPENRPADLGKGMRQHDRRLSRRAPDSGAIVGIQSSRLTARLLSFILLENCRLENCRRLFDRFGHLFQPALFNASPF